MIQTIEDDIENAKSLDDGVYDMTGIEFVVDDENKDRNKRNLEGFIKKYPDFLLASAYETDERILVATRPPRVRVENLLGGGFNYGSTNIIINCPKTVLILAEND